MPTFSKACRTTTPQPPVYCCTLSWLCLSISPRGPVHWPEKSEHIPSDVRRPMYQSYMIFSQAFRYQSLAAQALRCPSIRYFSASPATPRSESHKRPTQIEDKGIHPDELEQLFSEPTWSVESLLPPKTRAPDAPKVTSQQLHHLLRLSALPPPESSEQEQKMLDTLAAQLHFVGKIQSVDTTGVEPLRALRDETSEAETEQTISLETLKNALSKEKVIGVHHKRIQRDSAPVNSRDVESWDVLGSAERKSGKYFIVENERPHE